MTENQPTEDNLLNEFRDLGNNLMEALKTGWDRPERQKLQNDIASGLDELGRTLKREVDNFTGSPTGQRMKTDLDDLGERIRSGEVETKARTELVHALQTINTELRKVIAQWTSIPDPQPGEPHEPEKPGE